METSMNRCASCPQQASTGLSKRTIIKDPSRYKTVLCQKFEQVGHCPYQHKCQFAHGVGELRSRSFPSPINSPRCPVRNETAYMPGVMGIQQMQQFIVQAPPLPPVYPPLPPETDAQTAAMHTGTCDDALVMQSLRAALPTPTSSARSSSSNEHYSGNQIEDAGQSPPSVTKQPTDFLGKEYEDDLRINQHTGRVELAPPLVQRTLTDRTSNVLENMRSNLSFVLGEDLTESSLTQGTYGMFITSIWQQNGKQVGLGGQHHIGSLVVC